MSLEGRTIALIEDDPSWGVALRPPVPRRRERSVVAKLRHRFENLPTCRPDLVMCDLRLPDGTGEEVCSGRHPRRPMRRRFSS